MSVFQERIQQARAGSDARENVRQIKRAVIDELRHTDPRVSIKNTDYFNNTYAPDLVLHWPTDGKSRYLYIRTDPDPRRLHEDVSYLGNEHPVLFSLEAVGRHPDSAASLDQVTASKDVLVTDPDGLEALVDTRRRHPVVQLASAAVLQGGRGLIGEEQGHRIAESFSEGFDAARRTEPELTARAAATIDDSFDTRSSKRLGQFLQAVWVGSGGLPTTFPGRTDLSSDLSDEGFRFLLELAEFDDAEFWRRVGRRLTVERLAQMDVDPASPNFQHLIKSNLDVLWVRICRVVKTGATLFDAPSRFSWTQESGNLALKGARFTAYVARKTEDMRVAADRGDSISGEDLIARAEQLNRGVEQVDLVGPTCSVLYASQGTDATHDAALHGIISTLGDARVRAATIKLPEGRTLRCDFETRTAAGKGPAIFPIGDLVPAALRVMEDLNENEVSELDELFGGWRSGPSQLTLGFSGSSDEAALFTFPELEAPEALDEGGPS
ncbi:hypothetical protein [Micromonospora avicenniae]|uniref:Uncharacterized protein n=1 Tax=Micromonospora avicenniae TaxID=1198245 RepID=A0A1N7F6T2_9ACTN|nr:hypothetical protein [Micromonospora avicenniae]SIR96014.1 hypothetical protein SAMN05444858_13118 [Micromonospora avicenniae]